MSGMNPSDSDVSTYRKLMTEQFDAVDKMLKEELVEEVKMWRNIWGWVPSAIKYYVSRTGNTVGLSVRNSHRFLGVLLETHWELKYVEVGVYEKVYDQNDGQYFFERKIVKIPVGQIIAFDWIAERISEEDIMKEDEEDIGRDVYTEERP